LSDVDAGRAGMSRENLLEQRRNQMKETKRRVSDHNMIAAEAESPGKIQGDSVGSETARSSEVDYKENISIFRQHE
jgi:WD40 repeat protein